MGQFSKPVIMCGGSTAFTQREIDLTKKSKPLRFDLSGQPGTVISFEMSYDAGSSGVKDYQGRRTVDVVGPFTAPELIITGDKKKDFVEYIPSGKAVPGIITVRVSFKPEKKPRQSLRSFNIVVRGTSFAVKSKGRFLNSITSLDVHLPYQSGSTEKYSHQLERISFSGAPGCKVRLSMTYNGSMHGHNHDKGSYDKFATGFITSFTQRDKYWISNFTFSETNKTVDCYYNTLGICGHVSVRAEMIDSGNNVLAAESFGIEITYRKLKPLTESENIKLVGDTPEHPNNHFVRRN